MLISSRGQYAIRILLDLAIYENGEAINVKTIAERQELSEKYMEQILSVLQKGRICHQYKRISWRIPSFRKTGKLFCGENPPDGRRTIDSCKSAGRYIGKTGRYGSQ